MRIAIDCGIQINMKNRKSKYRKKARKQALEQHRSHFLKREGWSETDVRVNLDGEIKISKVLQEFADPYLGPDFDKDELYSVLMVSVIAWNLSMMSGDNAAELMDNAMAAAEPSSRKEVRRIIEEMVQRKKLFFSQYKTLILDFKLVDLGDDYHLSVMTMPFEKKQDDFVAAR